jgi:hypothetical protein
MPRAVKATLRCKKHIAFALEKYWIYFDKIYQLSE